MERILTYFFLIFPLALAAQSGVNNTTCKENGLSFNGNEYVELQDPNSGIAQLLTVGTWVKIADKSSDRTVIGTWGNNGKPQNKEFLIWYDKGNDKWSAAINGDAQAQILKLNDAGPSVKSNEWYHVAFSYNYQGAFKLYVNGNLVDSASNVGTLHNSTASLPALLARDVNNQHEDFKGKIDEVSVWNKEFGISQIQQLMYQPASMINNGGLVSYWNLNECSGQVANDLGPNNNSGQLGNSSTSDENDPQWVEVNKANNANCNFYATNVSSSLQGTYSNGNTIIPENSDSSNATGPVDLDYFSLGFQNNLSNSPNAVLSFDSLMTGKLTLHEVTYRASKNNPNYPKEQAKVYVSLDKNNWIYVGMADNMNNYLGDIHPTTFYLDSMVYKHVKIVDATDKSLFSIAKADAYDITSICAETKANQDYTKPSCGYYGNSVIETNQGTYKNGDTISLARSNPDEALGAPAKHQFFSTGFQNGMQDKPYIILAFNDMMTGKLTVYEHKNNPLETADIYISQDNKNWAYVGEADNLNHPHSDLHPTTFDLDYTTYKYVKVVNTTDTALWNGKGDGYDISGICAEHKATKDYTQPTCNYYGSQILDVNQGTYKNGNTISPSRSNPQDALGVPSSHNLFSLGFKNNMQDQPHIIVGFDSMMTGKLSIYEVDNKPIETADIYVSQDTSSWNYVGEAHNLNQPQGNLHPTTFELDYLAYQYVKIVNTTDPANWGSLGDGYDVAGICAEEKAPAYIQPSCGFYATQVVDNKQGKRKNGNDISANRSNPSNALDTPTTNDLYSLGFQDSLNVKPYLTLGFDEMMTGKLTIYEVNNKPLEKAKIYVSENPTNWTYVGEAHNLFKPNTNLHPTTFNLDSLNYKYVKIVNNTDVKKCPKGTEDAFDVAGICAEQKATMDDNPSCNIYGSYVVGYAQGKESDLDSVASNRSNPQNALGQTNSQSFYSLGLDTSVSQTPFLTIGFDDPMIGELTIHEVTWTSTNYPEEKAKVYVSPDQNNWTYVGMADNKNNPSGDIHTNTFQLDSIVYKYVKIVDVTNPSAFTAYPNADGFDVTAICAESTITTSDYAIPQNVGFKIYPNPVTAGKAVKVNTNATHIDENNIQLYNAKGKRLHQINIRQNGIGFSIQTNDLGKGIYMLRIRHDNNVVNKRVVIH